MNGKGSSVLQSIANQLFVAYDLVRLLNGDMQERCSIDRSKSISEQQTKNDLILRLNNPYQDV